VSSLSLVRDRREESQPSRQDVYMRASMANMNVKGLYGFTNLKTIGEVTKDMHVA
jgi:hypothetical protein